MSKLTSTPRIPGLVFNHNQTLVRPGFVINHNQTLVRR